MSISWIILCSHAIWRLIEERKRANEQRTNKSTKDESRRGEKLMQESASLSLLSFKRHDEIFHLITQRDSHLAQKFVSSFAYGNDAPLVWLKWSMPWRRKNSQTKWHRQLISVDYNSKRALQRVLYPSISITHLIHIEDIRWAARFDGCMSDACNEIFDQLVHRLVLIIYSAFCAFN